MRDHPISADALAEMERCARPVVRYSRNEDRPPYGLIDDETTTDEGQGGGVQAVCPG
jgi:hypothetical protein